MYEFVLITSAKKKKKQINCLLIVTHYKVNRNVMCYANELNSVEQKSVLAEILAN